MSDQPGYPVPPGDPAPPPPPPPDAAPPQPPPAPEAPAPAAYVPPAAPAGYAAPVPAPPAKKSKKGLWIALAIVALLLLCCCGGFGAWALFGNSDQAQYDEIFKELDTASAKLDALDPSLSPDAATFVEDAKPALADFRDAVKKARTKVEALGDSDKKKKTLEALETLDKGLAKMESVMDGLQNISQLQTDMTALGEDLKRGNTALSEGIDHANNKRWSQAEQQVNIGLEAYNAAAAKMAAIEKDWPGVGMENMTGIIAAKKAAAEDAALLVKYGRAGKYGPYNDTINAYNAHQRDINAANLPPFVEDPTVLTGDLWDELKAAVTETKKAIKMLEELE